MHALAPPYDTLVPAASLPAQMPPVGTVFCVDGRTGEAATLAGIAALTLARRRWPWVIPCLLEGSVRAWLDLVVEWFPHWRYVLARGGSHPGIVVKPDSVRRLIGGRPVPPPEVLGTFVGARLGSDELADLLTDQFAVAMAPARVTRRSSAFYSRHLARLSRWNARDWRIVARLALHVAGWTEPDSPAARTWAARSRRFLGWPWEVARRLLGWESMLELAVRRHGALRGAPGLPPGNDTAGGA